MKGLIRFLRLALLTALAFTFGCATPPAAPATVEVTVPVEVTREVKVVETVQVVETALPQPTQPVQPTKPAGPLKQIRIGIQGTADFNSLPSFLAMERLPADGYEAVPVFLGDFADDQAVTAVLQGDVDVADASINAVAAAIQQGADLKLVLSRSTTDFVFVAPADVTDGSQLDGKVIGHFAEGSSSTAMMQDWIKENWPGINPKWVAIGSSDIRVGALAAGQIDATGLEISDFVVLNNEQPGKFHILARFAEIVPEMTWEEWFVRSDWAAQNPDAVKALIKEELLSIRRAYDDPDYLRLLGPKYLPNIDPKYFADVMAVYLDAKTWHENGDMTPEDMQWNIDFFTRLGEIEPGFTVDQLSDRTYLDAVLAEIGKR